MRTRARCQGDRVVVGGRRILLLPLQHPARKHEEEPVGGETERANGKHHGEHTVIYAAFSKQPDQKAEPGSGCDELRADQENEGIGQRDTNAR